MIVNIPSYSRTSSYTNYLDRHSGGASREVPEFLNYALNLSLTVIYLTFSRKAKGVSKLKRMLSPGLSGHIAVNQIKRNLDIEPRVSSDALMFPSVLDVL